jgi:hypothetical protein
VILEPLRLFSAWMQHATHGINAQLDALDYDGSDPQPADIGTFADEVSQEEVALGQIPLAVPAVVATVESATMINDQVAVEVGDGTVVLNVRIAVQDVDAREAKRDGSYYLRALAWSLRRWVRQDPGASTRARNGIQIIEIGQMEFNALFERAGDIVIIGGARVPLVVRDAGLT